ncbi:hypothetical protein HPB52_021225 [Rhipicephalus sanguineus]|uniref:Retrotransposon gag domain-containing protein n=1 Tax=Rhipicephalus sanguineus TaxID=34632 RepID=A0A9D4Q2K3_RHISA|nr:hypothetical protein HPB52_021225 [Rhipicephalus sanguineus]
MENVIVPEEVVQYLIGQTDGSVIQRGQVASLLRQRVMAATVTAAPVGLGVPVPVPQPPQPPQPSQLHAVTSTPLDEPPKFSGFNDLQSPEVFPERLKNFCLVSGIDEAKRLSNVVPAALEGSAKIWWRFVGAFNLWDEFTKAFCAEFASIDSKRHLKEKLEQRTQHPEENLKEFIYGISAYYDLPSGLYRPYADAAVSLRLAIGRSLAAAQHTTGPLPALLRDQPCCPPVRYG